MIELPCAQISSASPPLLPPPPRPAKRVCAVTYVIYVALGVGEPYPKESIPGAKLRPLTAARQQAQLLSERKVFQRDRSVTAGDQSNDAQEDDKSGQHALSCRAFM